MSKSEKMKPQRPRNPLAHHPLMRKGEVHGKSKKAQRRAEKVQLKREYSRENRFVELGFSSVLGLDDGTQLRSL